jgi:Flp pilus assembly pilin Flp
MGRPVARLAKLFRSRKGQGLLEYALILVLVAIVVITGLRAVRGNLHGTMNDVFDTVADATR